MESYEDLYLELSEKEGVTLKELQELHFEVVDLIRKKILDSGFINFNIGSSTNKDELDFELMCTDGERLQYVTAEHIYSNKGNVYSYDCLSLENLCILVDKM